VETGTFLHCCERGEREKLKEAQNGMAEAQKNVIDAGFGGQRGKERDRPQDGEPDSPPPKDRKTVLIGVQFSSMLICFQTIGSAPLKF
jgi:hypothetical protein